MRVSFIVKASTKIGFGHLIRSRSLAHQFQRLALDTHQINFYLIGDPGLDALLHNEDFSFEIFESEEAFIAQHQRLSLGDVVIFDLLSIEEQLFELTDKAHWRISISPIFSHLDQVDTVIHRSKYFDQELRQAKLVNGLKYAIIQGGCRQIDAGSFKRNLSENRLSLAISMGGGDAANKTLQVIHRLNELEENFTIWAMLGEGYKHSYDDLIEASKQSHHEIILAKTNESMWRVLSLASLLILPGGVTSYEAAFAGLPTLNIVENERQESLIRELCDNQISLQINGIEDQKLLEYIKELNEDREALYKMHMHSKGLIDGLAGERIFEMLLHRNK